MRPVSRFTLTIPTVTNWGTDAPEYPDRARLALHHAGFAGWTEHEGSGVWTNDDEHQYAEPVVVFVIDAAPEHWETLTDVAAALADLCAQECVYLTEQPLARRAYVPAPASAEPSSARGPDGDRITC